MARTMATGHHRLVAKETTPCPYCGETHRVFVTESDEVVDALPSEGDIDWAKRYPFSEGYRYYHKKCDRGNQQELRVVVRE
jgi:hypothetical protein